MPYRYLEDIAIADAAFEAWGKTPDEMFCAAADALLNVMVEDPTLIRSEQREEVHLESCDLDMLLFDFLNELIFFKDARRLLLRPAVLTIASEEGGFVLQATLQGEQTDRIRDSLHADVKAVTLHRFGVAQTDDTWTATVVLDI